MPADYRVVRVSPSFAIMSEHETLEEAREAWKVISWRDVDNAITRYIIEETYA